MKKLITKVAELPAIFSLSNYLATNQFKIQDWLVNLEFRALRHAHLQPVAERKASADYLLINSLLPERVCRAYLADGLRRSFKDFQVTDQTVHDALSGLYYRQDTRLAKYVELFDELLVEDPLLARPEQVRQALKTLDETPMWRAFEEASISTDGETNVCVNLSAPEDQLVDEFRKWLQETKFQRGIDVPKRLTTDNDLNDLARFQTLPYLDLTFWAAAHGLEISNQVMGLALFPEEFEVALSERVRKTVAPLASKAVTHDYCEYFRSQVVSLGKDYKNLPFVPDSLKALSGAAKIGQQIVPEQ